MPNYGLAGIDFVTPGMLGYQVPSIAGMMTPADLGVGARYSRGLQDGTNSARDQRMRRQQQGGNRYTNVADMLGGLFGGNRSGGNDNLTWAERRRIMEDREQAARKVSPARSMAAMNASDAEEEKLMKRDYAMERNPQTDYVGALSPEARNAALQQSTERLLGRASEYGSGFQAPPALSNAERDARTPMLHAPSTYAPPYADPNMDGAAWEAKQKAEKKQRYERMGGGETYEERPGDREAWQRRAAMARIDGEDALRKERYDRAIREGATVQQAMKASVEDPPAAPAFTPSAPPVVSSPPPKARFGWELDPVDDPAYKAARQSAMQGRGSQSRVGMGEGLGGGMQPQGGGVGGAIRGAAPVVDPDADLLARTTTASLAGSGLQAPALRPQPATPQRPAQLSADERGRRLDANRLADAYGRARPYPAAPPSSSPSPGSFSPTGNTAPRSVPGDTPSRYTRMSTEDILDEERLKRGLPPKKKKKPVASSGVRYRSQFSAGPYGTGTPGYFGKGG